MVEVYNSDYYKNYTSTFENLFIILPKASDAQKRSSLAFFFVNFIGIVNDVENECKLYGFNNLTK